MALTPEDGTGLANADSLCSLAFATTYHADRGNAAWAALASDPVREQCLRRATDYMQQVYRGQWAGTRTTDVQALDWPRYDVPRKDSPATALAYYDDDAVPVEVQRACAELALRAATQSLAPDVGRVRMREKIDTLEAEYARGDVPWVRFRAVDNLLSPFLRATSGVVRQVVRA